MNAPHPEPNEYLLDAPESGAAVRKPPMSDGLRAWVARKQRERRGLPLRACDREQIREQLEDL